MTFLSLQNIVKWVVDLSQKYDGQLWNSLRHHHLENVRKI